MPFKPAVSLPEVSIFYDPYEHKTTIRYWIKTPSGVLHWIQYRYPGSSSSSTSISAFATREIVEAGRNLATISFPRIPT